MSSPYNNKKRLAQHDQQHEQNKTEATEDNIRFTGPLILEFLVASFNIAMLPCSQR